MVALSTSLAILLSLCTDIVSSASSSKAGEKQFVKPVSQWSKRIDTETQYGISDRNHHMSA
jgi:hypothetical protein